MTTDIVSKLFEAVDSKNYDGAANYLHDEFVLTGPFPEPQNKEMWLEGMKGMGSAFPDWKFNAGDFEGSESTAKFSVQITATHKGDLQIPNGPTVPATNKSIAMPREMGEVTFKDGKIRAMDMQSSAEGGINGILKQIGFEPPAH
ncbi:MAG: nuclear transport factor 2 family protein [Candidatus Kariarchaeaceae archaeon]|jgi:hypothetical protein